VVSVTRSELDALDARATAADQRVAAVQAGARPTVSFTAGADYANPNPRHFPRADLWQTSWEVGVVAAWTLWDGGRVAAESTEAAAAARALRARQADLSALFTTEVRQRRLDLDSARAVLDAANVAVQSAAEARRVVSERFNVGVATSTEVLDAQVALLQAELDRTRAFANIRLAEARLDRAMGLER
jgi:outer membrane protein TolC